MATLMKSRAPVPTTVSPEELCALLGKPASYPEPVERVELVETHISWVFLTETHAYKFKKPVRFEFLDFSTPECRRTACEAEVRLNRRLAPEVYLGVVPITRGPSGELVLEGDGTPVEWGVKMKRLPADRTLDRLLHEHQLTDEDLGPLAERLTRFYCEAAPLVLEADEYRAAIERHVRANWAELAEPRHDLDPVLVQRVHGAQLRILRLHPGWFVDRVCDGRILDGHGDLRPEHICLTNAPAVFDCLEFSGELRRIDVADELAFLGMECDYLGAHDVGARLWNHYAEAAGDHPPARLLDFYRSYRACVRAKVMALRGDQLEGAARLKARHESTEYLRLADRYAARLGGPLTLMVRGLAGSGKSTLARTIADSLGGAVLSTDTLRKRMPLGDDRYSLPAREAVYDQMLERASELLDDGISVVLDGTFLKHAWREKAATLARRRGSQILVVRCQCPADVARERIAGRLERGGSDSEARPELLERQMREEDPDMRVIPSIEIDSTLALAAQMAEVEKALV